MLDENVITRMVRQGIVTDTFRRLPAEKKEAIYRAAIRLFGRYGYDGLPIDRLCREAGISKGSFFQYFPTKSHLLEFAILMFDDYMMRWNEEVRRSDTKGLAKDRLLHVYHAVVVNSKLFPAEKLFFMFVTYALEHAGVEIQGIDLERHIQAHVQEIIERGEKTGEIRRDIHSDLTGYVVALMFGALVGREFGNKTQRLRPSGEHLISMLFDGIKA